MKKGLGLLAAALLLGAPAYAGGDKAHDEGHDKEHKAHKEMKGQGGSGDQGAQQQGGHMFGGTMMHGQQQGQNELQGQVLRVDGNILYLQHMGAVVPVQLQNSTQFEGVKDKKELKQGQHLSAQFTISKNQKMNLAEKITLRQPGQMAPGTGTGGSGLEEDSGQGGAGFDNEGYGEDPSGVEQDNGSIMKNEGTGGSGDIIQNPAGSKPEEGTGGAGDVGQDDPENADQGAVFDTGDTSGKTEGSTVPEGEEPGTGSPLPRGEIY